MKTAQHRCPVNHRTDRAVAECIWKAYRPAWVAGSGSWATLAWCQVLTVTLHQEQAKAEEAKVFIDQFACGGRCTDRHEVVRIAR